MPKRNWAEAIVDFVDDGDSDRTFAQRFWASFFGSALLHLSLLIVLSSAVETSPSDEFILAYLAFTGIVSSIFARIVSTGKKGGLIRRFWYGVTLPIVCYILATTFISSALKIQSEVRSQDQTNWERRHQAVLEELSFCLGLGDDALRDCMGGVLRHGRFGEPR